MKLIITLEVVGNEISSTVDADFKCSPHMLGQIFGSAVIIAQEMVMDVAKGMKADSDEKFAEFMAGVLAVRSKVINGTTMLKLKEA